MRKFFALSLIALLSLTMALAVVSCGGQQSEQPAQNEPAPAEQMPDTTMHDSMTVDTAMHQ